MSRKECKQRGKEHAADRESARIAVAVQDHQHEARCKYDLQNVHGERAPNWLFSGTHDTRHRVLHPAAMIRQPFV